MKTFDEWWAEHRAFILARIEDWSPKQMMRAAYDSALPQWQPIETAPKYEQILMLTKHGAIEGQWDGEVGSGYYWQIIEWYATHWMPLPHPPK